MKPQAMPEQLVVSPSTGSFAAIAIVGVSWVFPPKGMSTLAAPMVESKRSARPLLEATFSSVSRACKRSARVAPAHGVVQLPCASTCTRCCLKAPLEARNARLTSTIVRPRQLMRRRGSELTSAITVASRFSSRA